MTKKTATRKKSEPTEPVTSDGHLRLGYAVESLLWWARHVDRAYEHPDHLVRLCSTLEAVERGEVRRLIVSMPPRHGKSLTTAKRFPSWFLGRNRDKRVIIAAHTASLAETFSRVARNELAEHGPTVFGIRIADDSSSVQQWNLAGRKGGLVAAGVGGPLTGQGADLLIIDDPVKDYEAAFSQTQREAAWEWWRTVARTRVHPRGAVVLCMTRWHEDDLAGRLLRDATSGSGEKWQQLALPMVSEPTGEILWPERFPADEVAAIRAAVGTYAWEALYQQRPTSPLGEVFRRDWWRYYPEPPGDMEEVIQSWDCAFKSTEASDFVVGQVWGRKGANRYLLDQVRGRMGFPATQAAIRALSAKWPQAHLKLVEDKANGPAIIETLAAELTGIVAVEPKGGKAARAAAVSPQVEAGNVHLPRAAPWVSDFVEEAAMFPRGQHDDQVDAMTQALARLSRAPVAYDPIRVASSRR